MQKQQDRLWNKYFITIMIVNTLAYMGFILVNPIMTKYVIGMGATISFSGIVTGSFALSALFFRPFTGQTADWFDRKKLLVIALSIIALITLGYGLIDNAYIMLALRIVHGMFFSFFSTVCNSYGAAFIPANRLGEGVGYMGIGMIFASAVGPSISPFIAAQYGYKIIFIISFIIISSAALLMVMFKKSSYERNNKFRFYIKLNTLFAKELWVPMILGSMASLMNGIISGFILLYGDERKIANVSLFFIVNSVFILLARFTSGKIMDKKGLSFVVYPAFLLMAVSSVMFGFAHSLWMVLIAAVLYGYGQGSSQPSLQAYCIKKLGPARTGVAVSTFFLGLDIAQGLGPILGGAVIEKYGFKMLFCIIAIILLSGMVVFRMNNKKEKSNILMN